MGLVKFLLKQLRYGFLGGMITIALTIGISMLLQHLNICDTVKDGEATWPMIIIFIFSLVVSVFILCKFTKAGQIKPPINDT